MLSEFPWKISREPIRSRREGCYSRATAYPKVLRRRASTTALVVRWSRSTDWQLDGAGRRRNPTSAIGSIGEEPKYATEDKDHCYNHNARNHDDEALHLLAPPFAWQPGRIIPKKAP